GFFFLVFFLTNFTLLLVVLSCCVNHSSFSRAPLSLAIISNVVYTQLYYREFSYCLQL
ncbi:hypothetical protein HYDPIDRAFT_116157, partial [Hydnomerulius pinastri MD-312]